MQKIAVAIVSWNAGKWLNRCLNALNNLPERDIIECVAVVDNASSDTSLAKARQLKLAFPISFIGNSRNVGFARAVNQAIKDIQAKQRLPSHILLLNPDTAVTPNALKKMGQELDSHPQVAIVGPHLLNQDGTTQPSTRAFPTVATFIFLFLKLHRLWPTASTWQHYIMSDFSYRDHAEVDQVMGAAFLIRHTALDTIGLFDERFWIWFEEVDYCKRVYQHNQRVIYTPDATVIHQGAASFHQLIGFDRSYPFLRSALYYARKHLGFGAHLLLLFLWPLAMLLTIPASIIHMATQYQNKKRL